MSRATRTGVGNLSAIKRASRGRVRQHSPDRALDVTWYNGIRQYQTDQSGAAYGSEGWGSSPSKRAT